MRFFYASLVGLFNGCKDSGNFEVVLNQCPHLTPHELQQLFTEVARGIFVCGVLPGTGWDSSTSMSAGSGDVLRPPQQQRLAWAILHLA